MTYATKAILLVVFMSSVPFANAAAIEKGPLVDVFRFGLFIGLAPEPVLKKDVCFNQHIDNCNEYQLNRRSVIETPDFPQKHLTTKKIRYLFLGAGLMMLIYHLCFALRTRHPEYVLLALHNSSICMMMFLMGNQPLEAGILEVGDFNRNLTYIGVGLMPATYLLFSLRFLDIRSKLLLTPPVFFAAILPFCLFMLGMLFYSNIEPFIILGGSMVFCLLLVRYATFKTLVKRRYYRFFIIGTIAILIAAFVQTLLASGMLPIQSGILSALSLLTLSVLFFSLAVSDKLRITQEEILLKKTETSLAKEKTRFEEEKKNMLQKSLKEQANALKATSTQWINIHKTLEKAQKKLKKSFKEIDQKATKSIIKELDKVREYDNRWASFKPHFENLNPGFFKQLEKNYPRLSKNDQKILAFMKMNLSNGEIAEILSVTTPAIEQARRRMRKKMELDAETDLLNHIGNTLEETEGL